jgi:[acyl-carrier-protein] S-malonyltransferase
MMGKIAFLLAGQGSQYPGMGKELYEDVAEVKSFFDEAEKSRPGTLKQMFEGSEEELKQTINTQPCLFLTDMAAAIALEAEGIHPDFAAGFSLGEIAGLAVSGVLNKEDAFRLVTVRGKLMHEASGAVKGKMAAVLRMDAEELKKLSDEFGVYPVNYNCPGQIVVSGSEEKMDSFLSELDTRKVRYVNLPVSGAFHTPYMASASEGLRRELTEGGYEISSPKITLYSNLSAKPYPMDSEGIISAVSGQVSSSVRWEEIIKNMAESGADTFIECGPGNTLSGFVKRTLKDVRILNVSDGESLKRTLEELK